MPQGERPLQPAPTPPPAQLPLPPSERARDDGPSRFARFFLWCAGADLDVLERVPRSETVKQVGFGTLVLVPAVLALFAMTYALSTLTANPYVYISGGLVWSAIVFCFDRFIVSTFRKSKSVLDDVSSAVFLSRLVFAIFVGIIVAHPLVLLYFNDTIDERLALEGRQKIAAIEAETTAREQEINDTIAALKEEIRGRELERNDYQARLVDEIDGIVSGRTTGIPGRGPSAEEKKLQLDLAQRELEAARSRNLGEIDTLQSRIDQIRLEGNERVASFEQSRDYIARAGALGALAAESVHVRNVQRFLILFFVFVDTLPIVWKGFTPRGPYDDELQLAEFKSRQQASSERDSLERVLYPYMVIERENEFVSQQGYRGARNYSERYREFLDELSRHQDEFLTEWQRQQQLLAHIDDEKMRRTQLNYLNKMRTGSVDVVNKAVERFRRTLAWENDKQESQTS